MFHLSRMILLKKARIALREGRLDEAYGIVSDADLREHRQGQILSEKLVEPLLDRAEQHLADGRKEDALADVERAANLGGNRSRTASLREKALAAIGEMRRDELREHAVLDSIRRHIRAGQLGAAEGGLEAVSSGKAGKLQLEKQVKRLREATEAAQTRLRDHLEHGELAAALEAAAEALAGSCGEAATRELILEAARRAERALDEALAQGRFERARALADGLELLGEASPGEGRWREALPLCEKTAEAIAAGEWREARVFAGRLRGILPDADWLTTCDEKLREIEDAIHELRCGPLHQAIPPHATDRAARGGRQRRAIGAIDGGLGATASVRAATAGASGGPALAPLPHARAGANSGDRRVLWIDGVGSYLLLAQDRVTVGRAGSSARPDIALSADLEGIHAEILRVDGDYFIVARGEVTVGGRSVERHLLADGDEIRLGKRARLTFRMPTSLSSTAILELGSGLRVAGDVKRVILIDEHLLVGVGADCHVQAREVNGPVVLSVDGDGFRLKAPEPIAINGEARTSDERVPTGTAVQTGSLAFTITAEGRGGGQR